MFDGLYSPCSFDHTFYYKQFLMGYFTECLPNYFMFTQDAMLNEETVTKKDSWPCNVSFEKT